MLTKIKREDCLRQYPKFPTRWYDESKDEVEYFYPDTFHSYILTFLSRSFRGHATKLGKEVAALSKAFEFEELIFLGDYPTAWLYQKHDYKPVKDALQFLVDQKVGKRFAGGLQVGSGDLPIFIKHLAWLVRCNASLPYIHFMDPGQNILGSICQYGNIHFYSLNKATDTRVKKITPHTSFKVQIDQSCGDQFSKTGAIKGRQIIL